MEETKEKEELYPLSRESYARSCRRHIALYTVTFLLIMTFMFVCDTMKVDDEMITRVGSAIIVTSFTSFVYNLVAVLFINYGVLVDYTKLPPRPVAFLPYIALPLFVSFILLYLVLEAKMKESVCLMILTTGGLETLFVAWYCWAHVSNCRTHSSVADSATADARLDASARHTKAE